MALLDAFIIKFMTEGLDDVSDEAKETDKQLDELADTTEDLEEKNEDLSKSADELAKELEKEKKAAEDAKKKLEEAEKATKKAAKTTGDFGKNGLASFLVQGIKSFSPYILALNLLKNSFSNLQDAIDLDIPITKDTVNNIKDLEMTMRDIRSGTAQIGASIAELVLPVMNKLGTAVKTVLDFFKEHENFIKTAFIVTIIAMGTALWGALAPVLPELLLIAGAIAFVSLLVDDFITWLNGGNSALEDFWNETFGSAEEAKQFLNDLWNTLKELWQLLQPALKWLLDVALKALVEGLKVTSALVKKIVEGIKKLTGGNVDVNVNENVNGSHADGLDYVPFDGYIAKLHKGERVQTAEEADDWRNGLVAAKRAINFTAQFPLNSIPQGAISHAYNNAYNNSNTDSNSTNTRSITIGDITIQTQATEARGIATDLASAIKQAVISLDDGMLA